MVLAAFVYYVNNKMTSVVEISFVDESRRLRKEWKTLAARLGELDLKITLQRGAKFKNRFTKLSWLTGVGSLRGPLLILTSTII